MTSLYVIEPKREWADHLHQEASARGFTVDSGAMNGSLPFGAYSADMILLTPPETETDLAEVIRRIRQDTNATLAVVAPEVPEPILRYLEAGANGYVPEHATPEQAVDTLSAILQGQPPFAPQLGTALVERMNELIALRRCHTGQATVANPDISVLSNREREILGLIAAGMSNQEIAVQLTIEIGTVKNHVHSILKKLGASSRTQAVEYYNALRESEELAA